LGLHEGAEDGVDAGLVAGVLAEPAEEVGVEADSDDFFGHRHDDLGVFPEGFAGGVGVGIGENSAAYFGRGRAAQPGPVGGGAALFLPRTVRRARRNCFSPHGWPSTLYRAYLHNVNISRKVILRRGSSAVPTGLGFSLDGAPRTYVRG
jgi:hypothetical protein